MQKLFSQINKKCKTSMAFSFIGVLFVCSLTSCGTVDFSSLASSSVFEIEDEPNSTASTPSSNISKIFRDPTPVCLVPEAPGIDVASNEVCVIDYSNQSEGYISVTYTGDVKKIKVRVTGPDQIVYTYDLAPFVCETFPLASGNGSYDVTVYENIQGTSYSTCLYTQIEVLVEDEFKPFLYPNQYVKFNADSKVVKKGEELALDCSNDLDVIKSIYDYITKNIIYDYAKAADPPTCYTTDVDEIFTSGVGICLDYSAVMASMLRSQRIPTRLEIGYAQDAYHAWISIYTEETGWLNGIIQFDGNVWTLVDPTFGASTDKKTLKKFIGDGTNYLKQKQY